MKYAIVECGGKQYRAVEGGTIDVDRLPDEIGAKVELSEVLLISDDGKFTIGTPTVSGAKITAKVVDQYRAPKVIVFKYKARQRYRVKQGHRQYYTRLEIGKISGKAAAKKKTEPASEEKSDE